MDMNALVQNASVTLVAVAWKVAGAAALFLVGRWLIMFALKVFSRALTAHQFDVTLTRYMETALRIVLNVALVVAIRARRAETSGSSDAVRMRLPVAICSCSREARVESAPICRLRESKK